MGCQSIHLHNICSAQFVVIIEEDHGYSSQFILIVQLLKIAHFFVFTVKNINATMCAWIRSIQFVIHVLIT